MTNYLKIFQQMTKIPLNPTQAQVLYWTKCKPLQFLRVKVNSNMKMVIKLKFKAFLHFINWYHHIKILISLDVRAQNSSEVEEKVSEKVATGRFKGKQFICDECGVAFSTRGNFNGTIHIICKYCNFQTDLL